MAADCPDRPMQRRTAAASLTTSRPSTQARPASGCSRVVRMRTAVGLPAPFGPSTPSTVPRGTDRSIPRSARTSPNDLTRPSTRIAGPELVCDTPFLPIGIRPSNLPAASDSGESINAARWPRHARLPARIRSQEGHPSAMTTRPRGTHRRPAAPSCTSRYVASIPVNKTYREFGLDPPGSGLLRDRADLPHERRPEHGDYRHRQEQGGVPAELAD